jgi:hypothetical protein
VARLKGKKVTNLPDAVRGMVENSEFDQKYFAERLEVSTKTFARNYLSRDGSLQEHWEGLKTIMEICDDDAPLNVMQEDYHKDAVTDKHDELAAYNGKKKNGELPNP